MIFRAQKSRKKFDFHVQFAKAFKGDLDYYGHNLDALFDILTSYDLRPIEIVWHDSDISRKKLGQDFEEIIDVFNSVFAFENGDNVSKAVIATDESDRFTYKLL